MFAPRVGARHFHLGGPLEGPVLQQGELSMVCVGLSERDLIISMQWHDVTRKILGGSLGGQWPHWHPPIFAPVSEHHNDSSQFAVKHSVLKKVSNVKAGADPEGAIGAIDPLKPTIK